MKPASQKYRAELLLQKFNFLDQDTANLLSNPEELIRYIYCNRINWNDVNDRGNFYYL